MGPPERWPPELNEDVTAEILLRMPPDEPAHLFRAAVVCKLWLRVVSDPSFLRRYGAFHRGGAPLLGFFYNLASTHRPLQHYPSFVLIAAASSPPQSVGHGTSPRWALDCRHGRVLIRDIGTGEFVAWDPFSNRWDELLAPLEELQVPDAWHASHSHSNAVVLCAVAGCDHSSCRGGPSFLVVCVGAYYNCQYTYYDWVSTTLLAHVYSSESRSWCTTASAQLDDIRYFDTERGALIGDGVYFTANCGTRILKYDLVEQCLSTIRAPSYSYRNVILMQNEDGSLGIAGMLGSRLYLWSTMVNVLGVRGWLQRRVIKLEEILPVDDITFFQSNVIGFAEGVEVLFISTNFGAFTFELKSGRVRKVGKASEYRGVTPLH